MATGGAAAGDAAPEPPAPEPPAPRGDTEDELEDEVFLDVPQVRRERLLIPPLNFASVAKGVYRSGYPNYRNFSFLKKIGVRCMICLSAEEPGELKIGTDNREFIRANGIKLLRFPIEGQKEPFTVTSVEDIKSALREIVDVRNHPVLVHCDKGKHRTGTVIGCLRKLQGWALSSIFDEYSRFCKKGIRIMDHQLIEFFEMTFDRQQRPFLPAWLQLQQEDG